MAIAGCLDDPPTSPSESLPEPPRPSAVVYGSAVTLRNVTELQPLPGETRIRPTEVNRSGKVVGTIDLRPVIWEDGVPSELPVPSGFGQTDAIGISDDGRIMGISNPGMLMWEDGEAREFIPFPGHTDVRANINATGVVVGVSRPSSDPDGWVAWTWEDGAGTLLPPAEGYPFASAGHVNSTGWWWALRGSQTPKSTRRTRSGKTVA